MMQATAELTQTSGIQTCRGSIVCKTSDRQFSQLRITRAYIRLLCIPEGEPRKVLLARIWGYEIHMREASQTSSADAPLFVIELFDHDGQSLVGRCVCYDIEEGATAFEEFISR